MNQSLPHSVTQYETVNQSQNKSLRSSQNHHQSLIFSFVPQLVLRANGVRVAWRNASVRTELRVIRWLGCVAVCLDTWWVLRPPSSFIYPPSFIFLSLSSFFHFPSFIFCRSSFFLHLLSILRLSFSFIHPLFFLIFSSSSFLHSSSIYQYFPSHIIRHSVPITR